jgi:hypothetical protein
MKTKHIKQALLAIALLLAAAWWGGCISDPCNEPCTDEDRTYEIRRLDEDYDSLFPYDGTQKKLTYLYSNDTIEGDTLVFELYDTDTIEITGDAWNGGGCRCAYFADEVKTYDYKCENRRGDILYYLRIQRITHGAICEIISSRNESFSDYPSVNQAYALEFGSYHDSPMGHFHFYNNLYFNIVNNTNSTVLYCGKDSFMNLENFYNTQFGFLKLVNFCTRESYTFVTN